MKNKKIIIIIGVSILLLTVLGISYAFFTTTVTGEETDNVVTAGTLSLHFEDGDETITLNNAVPGNSVSKTFTVTNTGTLDANYTIWWKELTNEIINDELVFTLNCKRYLKNEDGVYEENGTCTPLSERAVGNDITEPIYSNIYIEKDVRHEYEMVITFKEMNKDQNYNQNKKFTGTLNIKDAYINNMTYQ